MGAVEPSTDAMDRAAQHAIRYRRAVRRRPHSPVKVYADTLARFDAPTPEQGTPGPSLIDDLVERASPGLHASVGPRFYGWVIGSSHPVGVAADWLTSAWGQNAGNHTAAPAAAAVEAIAARWLLDLLDLPREASVGFVTGATVANFVCLAAARGEVLRRVGWDVEADGLFGAPPVHVLIGDDAHSTVFSALQFLELGHGRVIRVASDEAGRIIPAAFADALRGCIGPTIAVMQAGQLNTGAFDPFSDIIPMAHAQGAWVHVDGAFGLWDRCCPDKAGLAVSAHEADSWALAFYRARGWTPGEIGYEDGVGPWQRFHSPAMLQPHPITPEGTPRRQAPTSPMRCWQPPPAWVATRGR